MKIAIVNVWGSNRGDEAMISSLLCHLEERCHDVELYARGALDIARFKAKVFPWITERAVSSSKLIRWIAYQTNHYFGKQLFSLMDYRMARNAHLNNLYEYDFVISSPAGPYLGDMYPGTEHKCLLPLHICSKRNIPYGILAVSCGPFVESKLKTIRNGVFEKASFWTVRENISYEHLKSLNLSCDRYSGSDLVFAHPYRPSSHFVPDALENEYSEEMIRFEVPSIIVVLNQTPYFTIQGSNIPFDKSSYGVKMGELLTHVHAMTGCELVIFPHFYGNKLEMQNINNVILNSKCADHIRVLNPKYNSEMQMSLYKKASFCISHRYHPTIFSIKASCPFFCIRHQFKVDGLLERFAAVAPDIRTCDPVSRWKLGFKNSWDNRGVIKKAIDAHLPDYKNESLGHLAVLDKYIVRSDEG